MKLYQKILAVGALIVGLNGCKLSEFKTLEGTIKDEFGTVNRLVESSGAIFGNESVKIGEPTYGLVLDVDGKEYTISVRNHFSKPIWALAKAFERGDKVKIEYKVYDGRPDPIGNDGIGVIRSDNVELMEKANK